MGHPEPQTWLGLVPEVSIVFPAVTAASLCKNLTNRLVGSCHSALKPDFHVFYTAELPRGLRNETGSKYWLLEVGGC